MSPPGKPRRTVAQLNVLRREAVAARLEGATLVETSRRVGLSAPTIIAAMRAYRAGGWNAIDVAPRGRRRVSSDNRSQQAGPVSAKTPSQTDWYARFAAWATAAPAGSIRLLTTQRIVDWFATSGQPLARATVIRRLSEQGLQPPNRHRRLISSVGDDYSTFARRARRSGATVLWIASRRLADDSIQLYAHDPRGHAWWALLTPPPTSQHWLSFLKAIRSDTDTQLAVVVPGTHLVTEPRMAAWLAESGSTCHLAADAPQPASPTSSRSDRQRAEDTPLNQQTIASGGDEARRPLTHLERLEAESIHIMREVVAEADNPVMLYSIGKDSAVMLHLARKAFFPAPPPFPLMHVDTTWKFQAMYEFRDRIVKEYGIELIKHVNPEGLAQGVNPFTHGSALHTDIMKTEGLKQALDKHRFDIAFGGARRDEEKSRAKERVFSFRTPQHRWEPKDQRPELWSLYNARKRQGESIRVFPISNWTELDIWQYIHRENIPIVPLYLAAERPVVMRDGTMIMVDDDRMPLRDGEIPEMRKVRFRTLGCYPLTGAVESDADTLTDVIREMLLTKTSERQGRMIDHDTAASMEKKKQEGYF